MVEMAVEDGSQGHSEQKKKVNNSEHILHRVAYHKDSMREDFSVQQRETNTLA